MTNIRRISRRWATGISEELQLDRVDCENLKRWAERKSESLVSEGHALSGLSSELDKAADEYFDDLELSIQNLNLRFIGGG